MTVVKIKRNNKCGHVLGRKDIQIHKKKKKVVKIIHYHYTSGVSIPLRKLHLNVELHLELGVR